MGFECSGDAANSCEDDSSALFGDGDNLATAGGSELREIGDGCEDELTAEGKGFIWGKRGIFIVCEYDWVTGIGLGEEVGG